jgi:hypothetical protein
VLGHCPGAESNHSPTAAVSFFKLFLVILTKTQCNISHSWCNQMGIVSILDFGILAFFGLGE